MVASEADTLGILRRLDKWHESFLDGTSQVSLEKFPFNETRPFLAEWLSKNIKWHCSCPPDDCQKTKSTISQNSLIWAQPRPRSSGYCGEDKRKRAKGNLIDIPFNVLTKMPTDGDRVSREFSHSRPDGRKRNARLKVHYYYFTPASSSEICLAT